MFIVTLAGHIGKDPETRFTASGQKVTSFSIATNHRKGQEEKTVWVRITAWGDRFDKMLSYLKKGSGVVVTGKMNPPASYTDKEGRTQFSLEVTAEMIEFSPFGRNDLQGSPAPLVHPAQAGSSADGEDQWQMGQNSHVEQGSSQGRAYSQSIENEALPF
jgi:single-strand DNA-binding protein